MAQYTETEALYVGWFLIYGGEYGSRVFSYFQYFLFVFPIFSKWVMMGLFHIGIEK